MQIAIQTDYLREATEELVLAGTGASILGGLIGGVAGSAILLFV